MGEEAFLIHTQQISGERVLCLSWNKVVEGGLVRQGFGAAGGEMIACDVSQVVILGQESVGSLLASRGVLNGERRWA